MDSGYIALTLRIDPATERGYVSRCPELEIASQGETLDEALENIKEAVTALLDTLNEMGETDRFFSAHKIKIEREPPNQAQQQVHTGEVVSVLAALIGSKASLA